MLERTNARSLEADGIPFPVDLVVVDVSFISATKLLPMLRARAPTAELLVLVKPQFEVGKAQVGKGGVVRDDDLRRSAADAVAAAAGDHGWEEVGRADSRLPGPRGNREIFLRLRPRPGGAA